MPATIYHQNGEDFFVSNEDRLPSHSKLPPAVYVVNHSVRSGFYLTKTNPFDLPSKVYGDQMTMVNRIYRSFEARKDSTGVMFIGLKGSGKTLASKLVCNKAIELGLPVILVNTGYSGNEFNDFLSLIESSVVFFDEFEKVYSNTSKGPEVRAYNDRDSEEPSREQSDLFTLFDGTISQPKKLYLLTANDRSKVSDLFINRPGRLRYWIEFASVDESVMKEYIEENLLDKTHTKALSEALSGFENLNFDMMAALIEEMNRFGESAYDALRYLNFGTDYDDIEYQISIAWNGTLLPGINRYRKEYSGVPMEAGLISIDYEMCFYSGTDKQVIYRKLGFDEVGNQTPKSKFNSADTININPRVDLVSFDKKKGYEFKVGDFRVYLTKPDEFDYRQAFMRGAY